MLLHCSGEKKCCSCEAVLQGPPCSLPCLDVVCETCWHEMKALNETTCPDCKQPFTPDWIPTTQGDR